MIFIRFLLLPVLFVSLVFLGQTVFASSGMLFDTKEVTGIRYVVVGFASGLNGDELPRNVAIELQRQTAWEYPEFLAVKELFEKSNITILPKSSDEAHALLVNGESFLTLSMTTSLQAGEYEGQKVSLASLTVRLKRSAKGGDGKWTHSIVPTPNYSYPFLVDDKPESYKAHIKAGVRAIIAYLPQYMAYPVSQTR